jgi:hypothetical protein
MCLFLTNELPVKGGHGAWGLTTADLNADGNTDIIVGAADGNTISVLSGLGGGALRHDRNLRDAGAGRGDHGREPQCR